jgi:predicted membrane protein
MGAGGMAVDLSGLILENLDVAQAVGELKVSLSGLGDYSADISQAVGSIVIDLPKDVGVRLEVSRAISSLDLPSDFEQRGDYYYSSGYDKADYKIDLQISQAVGSIVVR